MPETSAAFMCSFCENKQALWGCHSPKLSGFHVSVQIKPVSPFATYADGCVEMRDDLPSLVDPENVPSDDDLLESEPKVKPRPR